VNVIAIINEKGGVGKTTVTVRVIPVFSMALRSPTVMGCAVL